MKTPSPNDPTTINIFVGFHAPSVKPPDAHALASAIPNPNNIAPIARPGDIALSHQCVSGDPIMFVIFAIYITPIRIDVIPKANIIALINLSELPLIARFTEPANPK